jgi:hypothetical protein
MLCNYFCSNFILLMKKIIYCKIYDVKEIIQRLVLIGGFHLTSNPYYWELKNNNTKDEIKILIIK